jgi:hypothetical protein
MEAAAARVVEQHEREKRYPTFTLEDVAPKPQARAEPPPMRMPTDHCEVAHGRWQRFALEMIGRCVREADGELFAAIKPDYLKMHPVCRPTPDAPATFVDASGREFSTVKCQLVEDEQ